MLGLFHGAYPDHTLHPNGTIAQLGERAIEVRKVAGSIPARPIIFCTIPKYHWDIVKWGDMGWEFRLKLTALTHSSRGRCAA